MSAWLAEPRGFRRAPQLAGSEGDPYNFSGKLQVQARDHVVKFRLRHSNATCTELSLNLGEPESGVLRPEGWQLDLDCRYLGLSLLFSGLLDVFFFHPTVRRIYNRQDHQCKTFVVTTDRLLLSRYFQTFCLITTHWQ